MSVFLLSSCIVTLLDITEQMEIEILEAYIYFRQTAGKIFGLWFYDIKDREATGKLLHKPVPLWFFHFELIRVAS